MHHRIVRLRHCPAKTQTKEKEIKKEKGMTKLYSFLQRLARDERGQDMVEYALLAGFIAVAAGALLPGISADISIIFSKMASIVANAALQ